MCEEKLKERFSNIYKFSRHDNNKFILFLRKGVYPYEYMDDWEKLNETLLPEKEDFYSHLDVEDVSDADHASIIRVCKDFEIKFFGEYHDLYVQIDTLLLADVCKNFRNMCQEIHKLDSPKYFSAGLAWQADFKKIKVK